MQRFPYYSIRQVAQRPGVLVLQTRGTPKKSDAEREQLAERLHVSADGRCGAGSIPRAAWLPLNCIPLLPAFPFPLQLPSSLM